MKNSVRIFWLDCKRLRSNVIALVVLFGIAVIPTLYAWFNIAASWDPYGSTGNLKVAVASQDAGYTSQLLPVEINLGKEILSSLHENTQLDWVFPNADQARAGVEAGTYYAAIVLPESFSRDMMSVFSAQVTHPKITYYINEKENAIAPKVTEKGAGAVRQQVNETFLQTLSQAALDAIQLVGRAMPQDDEGVAQNLAASLTQIADDLKGTAGTIAAFAAMTDAASALLTATADGLDQAGTGAQGSLAALETAGEGLDGLSASLAGTTQGVSAALRQSQVFYTQVSGTLDEALAAYDKDAAACAAALEAVSGRVQSSIDQDKALSAALTDLARAHPELPLLQAGVEALNRQISQAVQGQQEVKAKLDQAAAAVTGATAGVEELKAQMDSLLQDSAADLQGVRAAYETRVRDQLSRLAASLEETGGSVTGLLTGLEGDLDQVRKVTGWACSDLAALQGELEETARLLLSSAQTLEAGAGGLLAGQPGRLQTILQGLLASPEATTAFLSSPVQLAETKVYPVANYGSAMTPFYSTLAIWVGAVVMAAMLRVNVSEDTLAQLPKVRPHQVYFGRMLFFLGLGLIQSTLICLGDLYFLEIQCPYPFLFLLAGWFTSVVYVVIIYTLTVSFGDIGKAVAVVLMVMQVAGSGGTFPIEVAPKFFQVLYPLLPFTHSMNAMRAAIARPYGSEFAQELACLALFLLPALLLGLVLRKPIMGKMKAFEKKLEDTDLM